MSADAETAILRVKKSSAEELAKAAVEIQVSGLILGNPVGFFYMNGGSCVVVSACKLFRCRL